MYSLLLEIYIAFISLVAIGLTLIAIIPRKKVVYNTSSTYLPKALVIVPCKGKDIDLAANLFAAQKQRYKNYDIIAVVDSDDDPSIEAIRQSSTNFIIADFTCTECSGKVRAISSAVSRLGGYDVYVVLDSDVLVDPTWLDMLIAPLVNKDIGISTGYPIFEPTAGFWSKVKHAWGFVGQGLMDDERTCFGWGGSLAFRKDLLSGKNLEYFSASISDDIALTRLAKSSGLKIAYVEDAQPVVKSDDNFAKFMEWANRQTALFIHGNSKVYYAAITFYCANALVLISSIALAILLSPIFLLLLLPLFLGAFKLWRRSEGYLYMFALYPIINFIYIFNLLKARRMKQINWRGRTYEIGKIANSKIP